MSQYFKVHAGNPQHRLLERTATILREGGLVVYPTDTSYAFGCSVGNKAALERIRWLRRTPIDHEYTLVCRDLSEIAVYARVDNWAYRLLRKLTPGPYTFILRASSEVPRRLQNPKRRSIGIRVPDSAIVRELLAVLGEPILSSTLQLPDEPLPLSDPDEIRDRLGKQVDAIIDAGSGGIEPTTVLDLSRGDIEVIRQGKGDVAAFEA